VQTIYEPKGKAREYCERAVNLYRGCGHRCTYCYAPSVLHMTREDFAEVRPRPGILEALAKEAPKHEGREVLLCFTCDPCGPGTDDTTVEAIRILQKAGCQVNLLTKAGERSLPAIGVLRPGVDKYGATLTLTNRDDSYAWEPGAPLFGERVAAIMEAKVRGVETWASLEPVIDPEQSLTLIRLTSGVVDTLKIGKWNYSTRM